MTVPATAALDIANMALAELGQEPVADLTTLTNKATRQCVGQYYFCRNEVLRAHPWNCATKRATLAASAKTISGATAANPVVITSTSHGLSNGDYVNIASVVGMIQLNGNRYKIANKTTHTFELQSTGGTNVDGSAYTAYVSGGTATVCPAWGYTYAYAVPSDFIRLAYSEDQDQPFKVMGALILSNIADLNIEYIYQLEDVSKMDQLLVSAIAARLAAQIALPLTGSQEHKKTMEALYEKRLAEARFADSREQQGEDLTGFSWVNGRLQTTPEAADTRAW